MPTAFPAGGEQAWAAGVRPGRRPGTRPACPAAWQRDSPRRERPDIHGDSGPQRPLYAVAGAWRLPGDRTQPVDAVGADGMRRDRAAARHSRPGSPTCHRGLLDFLAAVEAEVRSGWIYGVGGLARACPQLVIVSRTRPRTSPGGVLARRRGGSWRDSPRLRQLPSGGVKRRWPCHAQSLDVREHASTAPCAPSWVRDVVASSSIAHSRPSAVPPRSAGWVCGVDHWDPCRAWRMDRESQRSWLCGALGFDLLDSRAYSL